MRANNFFIILLFILNVSCANINKVLNYSNENRPKVAIRVGILDDIEQENNNEYINYFVNNFESTLVQSKIFFIYTRRDVDIIGKELSEQKMGVLSEEVSNNYLGLGVNKVIYVIFSQIEEDKYSVQIKLNDLSKDQMGRIIYSVYGYSEIKLPELKKLSKILANKLVHGYRK